MISRRFLPIIIVVTATIIISLSLDVAADTRQIKVGIYNNAPKLFLDRNNKAAGFFPELLNHIAEREGWAIEYVPCIWNECLIAIDNGMLDLMMDVAYSDARAERFDFNQEAVLSNWSILYITNNSSIHSILDLDGKSVGVVKGSIQHQTFAVRSEAFNIKIRFVETENFQQIFELMDRGEVDAGLVNRLFGAQYEHLYNIKDTSILEHPSVLHFIVRKNENAILIQALDNHLEKLKKEKTSAYYRAIEHWLKPLEPGGMPDWVPWVLSVLGIILATISIFAALLKWQVTVRTSQLQANVAVLEKSERNLAIAKEEVEQANKSKSEFLSSMSHELRTPLNAILGFAQIMQFDSENPLSEQQEDSINHIIDGGEHLLELVSSILDLAQIEADQIHLFLENISAKQVVEECVALSCKMGNNLNNVQIVNEFSHSEELMLRTDVQRLKQILLNLLSNAIKFNREGGTVTIYSQVAENDGYLRIIVMDTGFGISERNQEDIYQMFYRHDSNPYIVQEGIGVGLAVTRQLVQRLAGKIGFESEVGSGSKFWVELPLSTNEDVLIWSDTLRVGVDAIDRDHQNLIVLLNKSSQFEVSNSEISTIIDELVKYTEYHFRREEVIMEVCDYPELEAHCVMHRDIELQLKNMANVWRKNQTLETKRQLSNFLRNWLTRHIMNADADIAPYAKDHDIEIRKALRVID